MPYEQFSIGDFDAAKKEKSEKELQWEKKMEEINEITDAKGKGIDEGIKETVVAFHINELHTNDSCEGHFDRGSPAPYIEVTAPHRPETRFVGEKELYERIAEKYNISVDELLRSDNEKAWAEVQQALNKMEETQEYKEWNQKNEKLKNNILKLLDEFYDKRHVSPDTRLEVEDMVEGFRVHNGGEDYRIFIEMGGEGKNMRETLHDTEKIQLSERTARYKKEMKDFTEFLKKKYFEL